MPGTLASRMADPAPESHEEMLRFLEQLSGRALRTRAEREAYLSELRSNPRSAPTERVRRRWAVVKHATLAFGLLIAVLQYYLIDIYVQILALQRVKYVTPAALPALRRSALEVLRFLS